MPDPGTSQMEVQEYQMQYRSMRAEAEMDVMAVNRPTATETASGETLALNTQHCADL